MLFFFLPHRQRNTVHDEECIYFIFYWKNTSYFVLKATAPPSRAHRSLYLAADRCRRTDFYFPEDLYGGKKCVYMAHQPTHILRYLLYINKTIFNLLQFFFFHWLHRSLFMILFTRSIVIDNNLHTRLKARKNTYKT